MMCAVSFWSYACTLYQQEGVEPALLKLQDDFQLNINHLLFCAWKADQAQVINWPSILEREKKSGLVEKVVQPIREFRRTHKATADHTTYQSLKVLELQAEQTHIQWLEQQDARCESLKIDSNHYEQLLQENLKGYLTAQASLDAFSEGFDASSREDAIKGFISAVLG